MVKFDAHRLDVTQLKEGQDIYKFEYAGHTINILTIVSLIGSSNVLKSAEPGTLLVLLVDGIFISPSMW
jgi:hypothetical protein